MASLVNQTLARAYAGARTAPAIAEAGDRPRPAVVAEAPRPRQESHVETTAATTPAGRPKPQPLDLNALRSAPTTTPTGPSMRWSAGPEAIPHSAQAYASVEPPATISPPRPQPLPPTSAAAPPPGQKIDARLPEMSVPKPEPKPEVIANAEPELPPRREAPRLAASPAPAVTPWVIQLGAMDDEGKAREILDEARQRSRSALAKASPFTEKVVRDGATLYRARFSGFDEPESAHEACRTLKRNGFACFATRS
jgi:D-alanyl-D-alanine carboxypeptidase